MREILCNIWSGTRNGRIAFYDQYFLGTMTKETGSENNLFVVENVSRL
jgi:hypothetical protein